MMDAFCLVNLNARLYDPMLGRMTSEDPVVADPASAQSFDGYSYASNEPLAMTDTTGLTPIFVCGQGKTCQWDGGASGTETVVVTGSPYEECDGACGGDNGHGAGGGGSGIDGGGAAQPAKPPDPKKGQCSQRTANLAASAKQAGFASQAAGGGTVIVGAVVIGLSVVAAQPEGVAFGMAIVDAGNAGLVIGSIVKFAGSTIESYNTGDSSTAASAGAGEAASQATDAAATAAGASPAGPLVGAIVGQQVENSLNSNSSSCGS